MTLQDDKELIRVCEASEVAEGSIHQVDVEGLGKLAIYRRGDNFFATADTCTHAEASLAEDGYIDGFTVTCSWHDGSFDIRTGAATALPCTVPLKTYPLSVVEGTVFVHASKE